MLTQHDILSEISEDLPLIYQATKWVEYNALKNSPHVVVATEYERVLCEKRNIKATVIPHSIDIKDFTSLSKAD